MEIKIKKIIAILLVVCFLVSLTAATVSASTPDECFQQGYRQGYNDGWDKCKSSGITKQKYSALSTSLRGCLKIQIISTFG